MDSSIIKEEVQFVVTNYNFTSVEDFITSLEASESCKCLLEHFEEARIASIKVNGIPMSFNGQKVIALFNQKEGNIQFRYNHVNKTLEIASRTFDADKSLLETLLKTFAKLKAQEIGSVLFSFMIFYNTGTEKLKMFNSCIHEKVSDFKYNTGFTVYLPVDLNEQDINCQADYEISKFAGSEKDDHVYQIKANYKFDLVVDKADIIKRDEELNNIVGKADNIHNRFLNTGKEILNLNLEAEEKTSL